MKIMSGRDRVPIGLSWLLFALIAGSWLAVAIALDQSIFAVQPSRKLLQFGALNGDLLGAGEWWRVPVSQFLHVHGPHMFFNAVAVLLVGAVAERGMGRGWLATVYLVGGSAGQLASVIVYPALVSSGASQALMALCGATVIACRNRAAYLLVIPVLAVQTALDLRAAGTIKAGHGWGFAAGVLMGVVAVLVSRRKVGRANILTPL